MQRYRPLFLVALTFALMLGPASGTLTAPVVADAATGPPVATPGTERALPLDSTEVGTFFDQLINQQLSDKHIAGATVAVVKDDALLFAKGYGYADVATHSPVDADRTLFYIGSAGKLFTWTAVMQLVEQGKIDLHADINTYLDFRIPATYPEPITMANLTTHTAGFEEQYEALLTTQGNVLPLHDFLVRTMPARIYPPGQYSAYSNYGTALAGYIVQRVSGEPYERYITDHILAPLGMRHSAATQPLPPDLAPSMSKGYKYSGGTYEPRDFEWIAAAPAAPVRATATDIAKFMLAHLNDGRYEDARILQAATAQEMHRQQFTHDPRLPGAAYGFFLSRQNGEEIIWHDGESARFGTILGLLPARHVGVFVSYNTPAAEPDNTLTAFVDRFYPSSPPPPRAMADTNLGRFAGTYLPLRGTSHGPQRFITALSAITVSAGDGTLRVFGHRYIETEPGLFRQTDGSGPFSALTFRTDGNGMGTDLLWGQIGYARAAWYQTLPVHLAGLGLSLLLLLSAAVAWPLDALIRRLRRRPPAATGSARLARWAAGIVGPLTLLVLGWFVLLLLGYADTYVYPAAAVAWVTRLALLLVPLVGGVVAWAALAWKRRYWNMAWRVHYTAVAAGSVALVAILDYWHLFGMGS